MLHHEVFRAWSVASLLDDTAWLLSSWCCALSSPRLVGYDILCEFLELQQLVARFCDVHTEHVQTRVMTLAGPEFAIFGSED